MHLFPCLTVKSLDCHLTMKIHISNLVCSAHFELRRISSIPQLLSTDATKVVVSCLDQSCKWTGRRHWFAEKDPATVPLHDSALFCTLSTARTTRPSDPVQGAVGGCYGWLTFRPRHDADRLTELCTENMVIVSDHGTDNT